MRTENARAALLRVAAVAGIVMPAALLALQQSPGVDAATMEALLRGAPGTYIATNGTLGAATPDAAVPVLVQGDTYRAEAGDTRVSLAIGANVTEPWVMRLRLEQIGTPVPRSPGAAAEMTGAPGIVRETREFTLEPGSYEAVVALARVGTDGRWIGTVVRYPLSVPSVPTPRLVVGPVILGEKTDTVPAEGAPGPFIFGKTKLTPAVINRFRQADRLHIASRIHGWNGDTNGKPDLSVDYVFRQQTRNHVRFFNKTKTQVLNPQTLGRAFDGRSGSVAAGMTVPLEAFPPGEFEVDVRVVDKRTTQSVEQKARFVVVE